MQIPNIREQLVDINNEIQLAKKDHRLMIRLREVSNAHGKQIAYYKLLAEQAYKSGLQSDIPGIMPEVQVPLRPPAPPSSSPPPSE